MKDFKSAYPGTPDSFHLALENTCKELEQMNTATYKHIRRSTAWITALIAALLLAGLAYAATRSSLLEILFYGRTPNEEAQALLEPVGQSVTKDGITLTLGDYLVDGDEWYLSYSVESERDEPVLFSTAWSFLSNNERLIDVDGWALHVLGGSVDGVAMPAVFNETLGSWERPWDGRLRDQQPFEVTLLVRVAKPKMQLVIWPAEDANHDDYDWGIPDSNWASFKKNKQLPVYRHGFSEFPKWIADINRSSEVGIMKVCEDAGTVEPFTELKLSVTIDPAKGSNVPHAHLVKPQRYEFEDYVLQVDLVDLTPTKSSVSFRVIPDQWLDESGLTKEAYLAKFNRDYALLNAKGENLNGRDAGALAGSGEDMIRQKYGAYSVPEPLSELVDTLVLAPVVRAGEWPKGKIVGYDMEHAVTLKLSKSAPSFTAELQPLPELEPVMRRFFGADVDKLKPIEPMLEGDKNYASEDYEHLVYWRPDGSLFLLKKPGGIPTRYRMSGDHNDLPLPSDPPGKYTEAEAIELAKQFLSDEIGIDKALLIVWYVEPEDPRKERSRACQITFSCAYNGISVPGYALVNVTDEGVVSVQGEAYQVIP